MASETNTMPHLRDTLTPEDIERANARMAQVMGRGAVGESGPLGRPEGVEARVLPPVPFSILPMPRGEPVPLPLPDAYAGPKPRIRPIGPAALRLFRCRAQHHHVVIDGFGSSEVLAWNACVDRLSFIATNHPQ